MADRIANTSVEFLHPFRLAGVDGLQRPGIYEVETVEEEIPTLSFLAYRRISTTIALTTLDGMARQLTPVEPAELTAALQRDAETASHGSS